MVYLSILDSFSCLDKDPHLLGKQIIYSQLLVSDGMECGIMIIYILPSMPSFYNIIFSDFP